MHFPFVESIMKELGNNCTFFLVEYPLVPKVNHDELFDIVESVYEKIALKCENEKLVLMGDSAGGGMALILA